MAVFSPSGVAFVNGELRDVAKGKDAASQLSLDISFGNAGWNEEQVTCRSQCDSWDFIGPARATALSQKCRYIGISANLWEIPSISSGFLFRCLIS